MKFKKVLAVLLPVSFLLTAAAGYVLLFTSFGYPTIKAGTNGFGIFDFRFSYTADNVMTIFSHYTGNRENDWNNFYTVDFVFAAVSFIFTFLLPLSYYFKSDKHYLLFRTSAFSSIMLFVFNIIENILILRLLSVTPYFSEGEADIASGITALKWCFAALWIVSTILFITATIIRCSRRKKVPTRGSKK